MSRTQPTEFTKNTKQGKGGAAGVDTSNHPPSKNKQDQANPSKCTAIRNRYARLIENAKRQKDTLDTIEVLGAQRDAELSSAGC